MTGGPPATAPATPPAPPPAPSGPAGTPPGTLPGTLPAPITTRRGEVLLRRATAADVAALVTLLADDPLGATREGASPGDVRGPGDAGAAQAADDAVLRPYLRPYLRAFAAIDADPAHLLVVAQVGGEVVGTLQLSVLPGLARRGALRAQVEAVRVGAAYRSQGLGAAMLQWAVEEAARRGCALVQLTTDKRRSDAHRFYERLGFTASHEGYKRVLPPS